jgi:hypothetical protein
LSWFNDELVEARRPTADEGARLLGILAVHARIAESPLAAGIVRRGDDDAFWRVAPRPDAAAREGGNEGNG